MKNTDVRDWYRSHKVAHERMWDMHRDLLRMVIAAEPASVFEFGAGTGKLLKVLKKVLPKARVFGLDVNQDAAQLSDGLVGLGSEDDICQMADISFTCSVLNHIPDPTYVIQRLQEVSERVLLCESVENAKGYSDPNWFIHDYEGFGFRQVAGPYRSPHAANVRYDIFEWKEGEDVL